MPINFQDTTKPHVGYLCIMLAATLWALSGTTSKFLFQSGLTPFDLVQLRTTIGSAALLVWIAVARRHLLRLELRSIPSLALLGALLAATQFTYLYAVSRIHVAVAIVLQCQAPLLVALSTVVILRQRLAPRVCFALLGATAGCYLMVGANALTDAGLDTLGVVSGLVSAGCFAAYTMRCEKGLTTHDPVTMVFYAMLVAAMTWNIFHPPLSAFAQLSTPALWGLCLFVCIGGTVLPFWLYAKGVGMIGSARGSITATLEPVAAGFAAYFVLGELLDIWQMIGGAFVLSAVILLQLHGKK
ncbi:MAG TPA: DMT family transporter [Dissulfurispiraceae bacterium]|nr:DMT family transporter [Dissulfurispiraceae bacterium]